MAKELVQFITLCVIIMIIGIVHTAQSTAELMRGPTQQGKGAGLGLVSGICDVVCGGFAVIVCCCRPVQVSQVVSRHYLIIPFLSITTCGRVFLSALKLLFAWLRQKRGQQSE